MESMVTREKTKTKTKKQKKKREIFYGRNGGRSRREKLQKEVEKGFSFILRKDLLETKYEVEKFRFTG
jgi:hypothetical protein